jgi:hypothetical protein
MPKQTQHNAFGSPFISGHSKPDAWLRVHDLLTQNFSLREIGAQVGIPCSQVHKISNRFYQGERTPRKQGRKKGWRKIPIEDKKIVGVLLETQKIPNIDKLESAFHQETFQKLNIGRTTLYSTLKELRASKIQPFYEHPNKWKNKENILYYDKFLAWRVTLDDSVYFDLCFHDEVRIEKNCELALYFADLCRSWPDFALVFERVSTYPS